MFELISSFGMKIHELHEDRIKLAKQTQKSVGWGFHDPIEDDPNYQGFLQAARSETEQGLRSVERGMGFCHRFWQTMQSNLIRK